ncbi:MAG TPA: P-loop NTPase [Phycisphaerales bacterium]|nr:P-loop NTPase [Phycisphaerales bacterium]
MSAPAFAGDQASALRDLARALTREARNESAASRTRAATARGAKVVTIASGKGGVGKTNLAVNLSIAFAQAGLRVTLLDADLGTANADLLCGLNPLVRLDRAVGGGRSLPELAIEAPGGFHLVPGAAGMARIADLAAPERARLLAGVGQLRRDSDLLVIDTAAGIGADVRAFVAAADLALLVTTPEPTAIADCYALIKCVCGEAGAARPGPGGLALVVNQAESRSGSCEVHARLAAVCARFLRRDLPLLGSVAQDVRVPGAVRARSPLLLRSPRSPAARDLRGLAGSLSRRLGLTFPARAEERTRAGLARRLLGATGAL